MTGLKISVLLCLILQISQSLTQTCDITGNPCAKGTCCVSQATGNACLPLAKVGKECENAQNGLYKQYCPCEDGLSCDQKSGVCVSEKTKTTQITAEEIKKYVTEMWGKFSKNYLEHILKKILESLKSTKTKKHSTSSLKKTRGDLQKEMRKGVSKKMYKIHKKIAMKVYPSSLTTNTKKTKSKDKKTKKDKKRGDREKKRDKKRTKDRKKKDKKKDIKDKKDKNKKRDTEKKSKELKTKERRERKDKAKKMKSSKKDKKDKKDRKRDKDEKKKRSKKVRKTKSKKSKKQKEDRRDKRKQDGKKANPDVAVINKAD